MENIAYRGIAGTVVGFAGYMFGALDALFSALLLMICLDFLTGFIKALAMKSLSSQKMFTGGVRKIGILLIVAAANVIDSVMELGGLLRSVTISYFIANEGISFLENWSQLGLPVPQKLRNMLAVLGNKDKEKT